MTTIRTANLNLNSTPSLGDATPTREVQWRNGAAPTQSGLLDLGNVSSYFDGNNTIDRSAVDALRALPIDEQRRRLEAMALDAKASRDPLAAQRVVDVYLALGRAGGPEALTQLGPRLAGDIESLIDRADSASAANVAGASDNAKAAMGRIRAGTFTAADLQYFTDDRNKSNLSQLTAEDKALVIQALISTGTGTTDSNKFQDARRVINVLNSMRSVTEYTQVMSIVGNGDANKAHSNISSWVGDRAALKPSSTSEDITVSLNAAIGSALAKPAAHSERRVTFVSLTRDVGTQPPATGSAPGADTVTSGNSRPSGLTYFEQVRSQSMADGQLDIGEALTLLQAYADPTNMIERVRAGDESALRDLATAGGQARFQDALAREGVLRDVFTAMRDREIEFMKQRARKIAE